jgi:hypothetical protein
MSPLKSTFAAAALSPSGEAGGGDGRGHQVTAARSA